MINHLDFDTSAPVLTALLAAGSFPAVLAVICRLPGLRGRNALQFLASSLMLVGLWGLALYVTPGPALAESEIATSSMIVAGALLAYLEAWALLSRGYTLGLLLTLFRYKYPVIDAELAAGYRSGQGLGWIVHHRIGGLISARLVRREGDCLVLTTAGTLVARFYRAAIATLGLKVTG